MRTFNVEEIVKAVEGVLLSGAGKNEVRHICTDSRKAGPGELFFALTGENNDGHDYLAQVLEAGCRAVVVSDKSKLPEEAFQAQAGGAAGDVSVIAAEDTTLALQKLSRYYLDRLPLRKKIAVTGSVGKTSTRDMLYYVASTAFKTGRNPKNFNNGFGLPLSILDFEPDTEVAVLEMGMSAAGEIEKLARLARPDIAIITNIGISHIENLGSRENILKAKMEVTSCFDENSALIINADNDMLTPERVQGPYRLITCGSGESCDYRVIDVRDLGDKGIEFVLCHEGRKYPVKLPVPGAHNAVNAALAIAAGGLLGISPEKAIAGLARAELTEKRLNIKNKGRIKVIDDTYNACPDSMRSALNTLMSTETGGGRKIAVLGDMLELGERSAAEHFEIGRFAAEKGVDLLVAVGKAAAGYAKGAETFSEAGSASGTEVRYYEDRKAFLKDAAALARPGDAVLVKASRGMAMEEAVREILKDKE